MYKSANASFKVPNTCKMKLGTKSINLAIVSIYLFANSCRAYGLEPLKVLVSFAILFVDFKNMPKIINTTRTISNRSPIMVKLENSQVFSTPLINKANCGF